MERSNIKTTTETPSGHNSPHISGSSATGVGKIDTNRISIHDLTAKRVYFEPSTKQIRPGG
jgi:hypothetical protein|nr:hypothetical protein [uncultured Schaedlerella sp.]